MSNPTAVENEIVLKLSWGCVRLGYDRLKLRQKDVRMKQSNTIRLNALEVLWDPPLDIVGYCCKNSHFTSHQSKFSFPSFHFAISIWKFLFYFSLSAIK